MGRVIEPNVVEQMSRGGYCPLKPLNYESSVETLECLPFPFTNTTFYLRFHKPMYAMCGVTPLDVIGAVLD